MPKGQFFLVGAVKIESALDEIFLPPLKIMSAPDEKNQYVHIKQEMLLKRFLHRSKNNKIRKMEREWK